MKLRIHLNSIRVRVSREEADALARGQALEQRLVVGPREGQTIQYRVVMNDQLAGSEPCTVELNGLDLTISLQRAAVDLWHASPKLELEAGLEWDGGTLRVSIEKDMQRLNPKPGMDESNLYANPVFGKVRCEHP